MGQKAILMRDACFFEMFNEKLKWDQRKGAGTEK
jgi:hypothetical protein